MLGRFWVEDFRTVPPPEQDGYIEEMNRLCKLYNIDLVIPQTTRETAILAANLRKVNVPVTVSSGASVRKANNKADLLRVFRKLGLPSPRYYVVKSADELGEKARRLGYPSRRVVVRPPVSFGGRGFRILSETLGLTREEFLAEKPIPAEITVERLKGILANDGGSDFPELLLTEFLPGAEYSVDAFVGKKIRVAIPRVREKIVDGISFRTTLEYRADLSRYTLAAAKEIGLKYAFGFQFKLDAAGVPKVLECNPRVQGTMVASLFGGPNIIWMAAKEALGEPPTGVPRRQKAASFIRFWGGAGVSDGRLVDEI